MAVHFINPDEKYLITTNYKVWFSTLTAHKNLVRSTSPRAAGHKHYFFVRNPYERLESFYRDKLFDAPSSAVFSPTFEWQHCHHIFLRKLGGSGWSFDEQRKCLQSISFQKFIALLEDLYCLDLHLVPQTLLTLKSDTTELSVNTQFDRILKVEEQESIAFIKNKLKIDTSIKRNYTKDYDIDLLWSSGMRSLVNHLYKKDFLLLGYPMIN